MTNEPPKLIAINHDEDHAEYVGRTRDGRQFFLTTPFEPAINGQEGREFLALFLFDAQGSFWKRRSTISVHVQPWTMTSEFPSVTRGCESWEV